MYEKLENQLLWRLWNRPKRLFVYHTASESERLDLLPHVIALMVGTWRACSVIAQQEFVGRAQFRCELLERRMAGDADRQPSRHGDFHRRIEEIMNTLRQLRKFWMLGVTAVVLTCSGPAVAQTTYKITDLGVNNSKDNFEMAMGLNSQGWTENMDGTVNPPENSLLTTVARGRAVISIYGYNIDLGTLGKPGANSWINWGGINNFAEAVGMSETANADPNGEDICGFGTHLICVPFLWRDGHMSALPTFGGYNGQASAINNRGETVGFAENGALDSTCPAGTTNNRISIPALWARGIADALPLVGNDPDGFAFGVNDRGQAVGYSGNCTTATHAVMWKDNTAYVLRDLGGSGSNFGFVINNRGQIAGEIGSADGTTFYAGVWLGGADGPVTNIGTLPEDFGAFATGLNERGQVVGNSIDSNFNWAHGFIWQDGVMTDLNTLIPADSNLFIISASNINDHGQISGMATVLSGPHAGDIHAYLLNPADGHIGFSMADFARTHPHSVLSVNACNHSLRRFGRLQQ
jgi:probable HAF family extracellular repeat protein